jgi:hypothetical protein
MCFELNASNGLSRDWDSFGLRNQIDVYAAHDDNRLLTV